VVKGESREVLAAHLGEDPRREGNARQRKEKTAAVDDRAHESTPRCGAKINPAKDS